MQYADSVFLSIPGSAISIGIALAISAMAFPSCCILLTLATIETVLVLVVIISRRTTPTRKSRFIMIPVATRRCSWLLTGGEIISTDVG